MNNFPEPAPCARRLTSRIGANAHHNASAPILSAVGWASVPVLVSLPLTLYPSRIGAKVRLIVIAYMGSWLEDGVHGLIIVVRHGDLERLQVRLHLLHVPGT